MVRFHRRESGVEPILHLALFNPVDDHYGLSPVEAAATAIDVHNAAGAWNKALLDNAARPSGALVYESRQGLPLADEQFERLKRELEQSFQGASNAGRPLLLEGGLDWKPLSLSPRDMDFIEAKHGAAREIALAFGVPPMLLGLPGDNTYANYAEANRSFWRQTVLPLVGRTAQSLAAWLAPDAPALRLMPDLDRIDALADEREALWRRIGAADFLTDDEKREAVGYGARGGTGVKYSPDQPRVPPGSSGGGQWTSGGGGGDISGQNALSGGARNDQLTTGAGSGENQVDLATEDQTHPGRRSHPAAKHVGLSEREIAATIEADATTWLFTARYPVVGSFRDMESANRFVNGALIANSNLVERLKDGEFGKRPRAVVHFFDEITGTEGYKTGDEKVRFRRNTGVRVVIQRDESARGFRVLTAFPLNKTPVGERWP